MVVRVGPPSQGTHIQLPPTRRWAWTIRPVLIWLRILGVELAETSTLSVKTFQWLTFAYKVFCFLLNITCLVGIFYFLHTLRMQASLDRPKGFMVFSTETGTWNWIIDFINYGIHAIGTHVILLVAMRPIDLFESFDRMKLVLAASNCNRIRRISSLGIVYIILVVSGILLLNTDNHFRMRKSFDRRLFITAISTLSAIYPMTALLLFAIHCYASSLAFELIQAEIERSEIQLLNSQPEDVRLFVVAVRQRYFLACDTVDNINYSFGWILLLSTTFYFVAIINSSFYLFDMEHKTMADFAFLLFALVHLILMCSFADCVSNKAGDVIGQLLKFKHADELLACNQMEVEFLVTHMAQTIPQISANGYFNVSKKLLPQVAGAALTYFFILCEFKASEQRLPLN